MSWPRKREYVEISVAAFLAVLYAIAGTMDYQDALIAEASRLTPQDTARSAMPREEADAGRNQQYGIPVVLSFPLAFKATVCQRRYAAEEPLCRYYSGSGK